MVVGVSTTHNNKSSRGSCEVQRSPEQGPATRAWKWRSKKFSMCTLSIKVAPCDTGGIMFCQKEAFVRIRGSLILNWHSRNGSANKIAKYLFLRLHHHKSTRVWSVSLLLYGVVRVVVNTSVMIVVGLATRTPHKFCDLVHFVVCWCQSGDVVV